MAEMHFAVEGKLDLLLNKLGLVLQGYFSFAPSHVAKHGGRCPLGIWVLGLYLPNFHTMAAAFSVHL